VTRYRPTVVEIDLEAIAHNVRLLRPPGAELMAVVKADGYGHGDAEVARAALEAGALGSSISGSGPTAFALARGRERAERVAAAMVASHAAGGRRAESVVGAVDRRGARLTGDGSEES